MQVHVDNIQLSLQYMSDWVMFLRIDQQENPVIAIAWVP